jgi:hypothetical protein
MSGGSSAFRRSCKVRALRQRLIDERTIGLPDRAALLFSASNTRSAREAVSSIHCCTSAGRVGSGDKIGQFAGAGERQVHFGDASAGLRHVAQIGRLLFAFAGMLACGQQALFLDKAVEIGRRHGPAVALIFDKGVHDRDRAFLLPSTSSTLPSSAGVLAKSATSVRNRPISMAGLMPDFELPIELDDIVAVHQRGAVGWLGLDDADALRLLDRLVWRICWSA